MRPIKSFVLFRLSHDKFVGGEQLENFTVLSAYWKIKAE